MNRTITIEELEKGGVGCSCYRKIFRAAGYTVHADERAKRYDRYTISKI